MKVITKIRRNPLLKSGINYSMFSTLSTVCTMIIGFLNMRWLGPELLGLWQSIAVINLYLPFLQLGVQSGLNLELPLALGANKSDFVKRLVSTGLAFAIILSVLLFVVAVIVIAVLFYKSYSINIIGGVITVIFIAISSCFRLHYIATYRSAGSFDKLAKIYLLEIIAKLLLVYLIFKFLYFGLLLFQIGIELVFTFGLYYYAPYKKVKPIIYKNELIILLKRGIFMTCFNQLKNMTASAPTLMLLYLGGVLSVGYFNPALTLKSLVNLLPLQIAQFLHPQMGYKYAQSRQARDMWPLFKRLTIWVPICLFPFAIVGIIACPIVISELFPKYVNSIDPICIMIIGFMFSSTFFTRGFLITIKSYKTVISLELFDFVMFVTIPALLIKLYPNQVLVAMASGLSIAYFISYVLNIFVVRAELFKPKYNI